MHSSRFLLTVTFAACLMAAVAVGQAQSTAAPDALFQKVQALDTQLFDAVNHCDLATLSSMVAPDLEFYHDKTGLAVGRQVFLDSVQNNLCGKVSRQLVAGTLEVYPLASYGAVEIGVHRFYHPGDPNNVGEAKFIHIWKNADGKWTLTRVISYDHQSAQK